MLESDTPLSYDDFTLKNEKNVLANLFLKNLSMRQKRLIVRSIPLQVKALLGSEYDFVKTNIFYSSRDLLKDSMINELVKAIFMSIVKVQYLHSYGDPKLSMGHSSRTINNVMWRDLNSYTFGKIRRQAQPALCKFVVYENPDLKVDSEFFETLGIENQYFFLAKRRQAVERVAPSINSINQNISEGYLQETSNFARQIGQMSRQSFIGCRSLVITQTRSKNGPLGQVDYGLQNDLTEGTIASSVPQQAPAETMTQTTMPQATMPSTGTGTGGYGGGY